MSISSTRPNALTKFQTVPKAIREASRLTIRRTILLAFLCMVVITAGAGAYAIRNVVALSYATAEASHSEPLSTGDADTASAGGDADTASAGDGLPARQLAGAAIADAKFQALLRTIAAMILGCLVAMVLARRIMALIFRVSALACRIAAKGFDTDLSNASAAESGTLSTTIATMRANIAAMTALEIAGREQDKPVPARTIAVAIARAGTGKTESERAEVAGARPMVIGAGISF